MISTHGKRKDWFKKSVTHNGVKLVFFGFSERQVKAAEKAWLRQNAWRLKVVHFPIERTRYGRTAEAMMEAGIFDGVIFGISSIDNSEYRAAQSALNEAARRRLEAMEEGK